MQWTIPGSAAWKADFFFKEPLPSKKKIFKERGRELYVATFSRHHGFGQGGSSLCLDHKDEPYRGNSPSMACDEGRAYFSVACRDRRVMDLTSSVLFASTKPERCPACTSPVYIGRARRVISVNCPLFRPGGSHSGDPSGHWHWEYGEADRHWEQKADWLLAQELEEQLSSQLASLSGL